MPDFPSLHMKCPISFPSHESLDLPPPRIGYWIWWSLATTPHTKDMGVWVFPFEWGTEADIPIAERPDLPEEFNHWCTLANIPLLWVWLRPQTAWLPSSPWVGHRLWSLCSFLVSISLSSQLMTPTLRLRLTYSVPPNLFVNHIAHDGQNLILQTAKILETRGWGILVGVSSWGKSHLVKFLLVFTLDSFGPIFTCCFPNIPLDFQNFA